MGETTMTVVTAPIAAAANLQPDIPDVPIYRLSIEQYHAIARAGIIDEDAPVELLEGWLVQKMTKRPLHRLVTGLVREALERAAPPGYFVDSQEPITIAQSEPEPDAVVIRGTRLDYRDRHPDAKDVPLVVEVADTSLRTDKGTKKRVYAGGGIPVYWVVNLKLRRIEVYTEPQTTAKRSDYRQSCHYRPEETIPVVLDSVEIGSLAVRELLP
jgi:Uma2 family endonuclease